MMHLKKCKIAYVNARGAFQIFKITKIYFFVINVNFIGANIAKKQGKGEMIFVSANNVNNVKNQ